MTRANDEAAGAARGFVSPFTQVDDTSADIRQELGDYLDRLATLPGIQRVRRTARAALDVAASTCSMPAAAPGRKPANSPGSSARTAR